MVKVMGHLSTLIKPEGAFVIGDFIHPKGNIFTKAFQNAYWYIAVFTFTVFAKNAFHKIYNYPQHLENLGFSVQKSQAFNVLLIPSLWSLKAYRKTQIKTDQEAA